MRVGFFGGTFDPPHNGHLAVAQAAVRELQLDKLLLAPTGKQPLKSQPPIATYQDRLAMVELLCAGNAALEASEIDAPRADASSNYTIDAVRELRRQLKSEDAVFLVVGADAFRDLRKWREPDALLREAQWIVVSRPGFSLVDLAELQLSEEQRARVHLLRDVAVPISATELRVKLRDGEDCGGLVPGAVLEYIRERGLYLEPQ